jgi:hypothetical protein
MTQEQLLEMLTSVTGHLQAESEADEPLLEKVQQKVAGVLLKQDPQTLRNQTLSIQSSDLFFTRNIQSTRLTKLSATAERMIQQPTEDNLRVFVREVPVQTTQISGSLPQWAAGAKVVETAGPFLQNDGRRIWVDFYRVEKLVALYVQGQALPALLFKTAVNTRPVLVNQPPVGMAQHYTLLAGSVWINARLLSPQAPADRYCGLRVKGGSLQLSALPVWQNNRLEIGPAVQASLKMELQTTAITDADPTSPFGVDARNAEYHLPESFAFSFSGQGRHFQEIGPMKWKVYGQSGSFAWSPNQQQADFQGSLNSLLIPFTYDQTQLEISQSLSPFVVLEGKAAVEKSYWALPCAQLDIGQPLEADGSGAIVVQCGKGLSMRWPQLENKSLSLVEPWILGNPAGIGIIEPKADGLGATQRLELWKDDLNPHGTRVDLRYAKRTSLVFITASKGDEMLWTRADSILSTDRPVKVNGEAIPVRSKNTAMILSATKTRQLIYLLDDNLIEDNTASTRNTGFQPNTERLALAMDNALFTTTPAKGCLLFGECSEEWKKVSKGALFLTFGVYHYLPTLPDPYAANLGILRRQFEAQTIRGAVNNRTGGHVWMQLVAQVRHQAVAVDKPDEVKVSFHFGEIPLQDAVEDILNPPAEPTAAPQRIRASSFTTAKKMLATDSVRQDLVKRASKGEKVEEVYAASTFSTQAANARENYEQDWEKNFGAVLSDAFALLDVSSHANQLGVSFGGFGTERMTYVRTAAVAQVDDNTAAVTNFPFIVEGMEVMASGRNVRAFTLPQIAWEPVFNLTPPPPNPPPMDPPIFFNYYPNDGGPTRIFNNSRHPVALAPLPLSKFLIKEFEESPQNETYAAFTLSFGIKAIALISRNGSETEKPELACVEPKFPNDFQGGIQIRAVAGNHGKKFPAEPSKNDSPMFPGYTLQLNNILGMNGDYTGASTLGDSVTRIFNGEFFTSPLTQDVPGGRGVPVEQIDFSGYGASTFSNWLSPSAEFASTSQARFDVMMGRTAHEVIQVKSVLYPWGIRVVRTITLFRVSSGYVYRVDSGWKAESDGKFDFRFSYFPLNSPTETEETPYEIHPGVIKGLFNVRNIVEDNSVAPYLSSTVVIANGQKFIDVTGHEVVNNGAAFTEQAMCRAVWFDTDVEIENAVQGHTNGRVVSKKVLGYVQLAPTGRPLTREQFRDLLDLQGGKIGGTIDCVVNINNSEQQMRLNRFDVNTSQDTAGNPVFVAAARGNVLLPKDGSWSMVQHAVGSGEVTPLPESVTVPLIRVGKWLPNVVVDPAAVANQLIRIAHPKDLLRNVAADSINFGFLQSTATQKALFLTPAFGHDIPKLLSKTPPIFADAYRLMSGKSIFPNIGDAVTNYGKAMALVSGVDKLGNAVQAFTENALQDGGKKVLEILEVQAQKQGEAVLKQGLSMLQKGANGLVDKALQFDVPSFNVPLVDIDALKIYIEYKTSQKQSTNTGPFVDSKLNFDIDSFAGDMANQWKSRMNNLAMVVDLGPMEKLMTIKGNFDARKGKESDYGGGGGGLGGLPIPEIEFSDELQPVIDILQILASLSSGDYADALNKGLKVAMSNSGEIWEYKFEAGKEIPLVRFPPTKALYDSPQTPLKLEASMGLGVYFNAALKVTTDPKQLLPTAGAFLQFYGGLSVMCFSLAAATIYAKGSVDLKIACDTKVGPSLAMKFGFGAQIVVGLPVVGNVSVLYMVGVEMYADSGVVKVAAFMLFRGHAELLSGLVAVTITIEAKGIIVRDIANDRTECAAQVTFGLDISIFLVIDISFEKTWGEERQIA